VAIALHGLVEASAAARPDAIAVVDRDRRLTYAELDAWSNRVANLLLDLGVQRGDRVALYLEKSLEAVAALYGVLKAGAAYTPLDPGAPVARLGYIAGNCGARVVLTEAGKADTWAGLVEAGAMPEAFVAMAGDPPEATAAGRPVLGGPDVDDRSAASPAVPVIDLDLAYILYTSGSTGAPKGVKLTHRNALTFVDWAVAEFGVGPDDVLSSHAPFHFDLSVFDLYAAAEAGATLALVPPKASVFPSQIASFIEQARITVWYSVPSILTMLVLRGGLKGGEFPTLRTLLFAGEVFPTKYLRQLMALLPHARFANLYGPTETNVCTWYDVPPLPDDQTADIPIGRAIDNVEVFAVTDDGKRASLGELGELYVRGTTVMQGYWGDRERTDRMLVPHPFAPELRDLVYRTGDLVEELPGGDYRFLGRRDAQVKSRGYRIELGEVESALNAHPSVVECAVVAVPDEVVTNRIRAFAVVRDPAVTAAELARFCGERVPRYMVPEAIDLRDELAKTSTGKIDRQALRADAAGAT
jgi:amino acid adenylation domain-containing protein